VCYIDYNSKPFRPRELLARIHTVLRRTNEKNGKNEILVCKDISVDTKKAVVRKKGKEKAIWLTLWQIFRIS